MTRDGIADHVIERALERYGIVLTWGDLRVLEDRVARRDGMLLRRDLRGETWVIRVEGQLVTLIFEPGIGRIRTILPADKPFASGQQRWREERAQQKYRGRTKGAA